MVGNVKIYIIEIIYHDVKKRPSITGNILKVTILTFNPDITKST